MAQKINPINFKLGVTQVWNTKLQTYGKFNKVYSSLLHKNLQLLWMFMFLYKQTKFLFTNYSVTISKNNIFLSTYYSNKVSDVQFYIKNLSSVLSKWFELNLKVKYYPKHQWFYNVELIINYTQHLLANKENKITVLKDLCSFFKSRLGSKKIVYSVVGPIKIELIGFKVSLSGRIDASGNQMAKTIAYKTGILSLTSIKNYIEFSNFDIYTNSGVCGFQVWLLYKIR